MLCLHKFLLSDAILVTWYQWILSSILKKCVTLHVNDLLPHAVAYLWFHIYTLSVYDYGIPIGYVFDLRNVWYRVRYNNFMALAIIRDFNLGGTDCLHMVYKFLASTYEGMGYCGI